MISAQRILAGLAAAGITAAIALTPTTSSDAFDAKARATSAADDRRPPRARASPLARAQLRYSGRLSRRPA